MALQRENPLYKWTRKVHIRDKMKDWAPHLHLIKDPWPITGGLLPMSTVQSLIFDRLKNSLFMGSMNLKWLAGYFILLTVFTPVTAQRIIVNSNGDRIVMYPDGSWRAVESGDSVLLRQNLQKSEALDYKKDGPYTTENHLAGEHEEHVLKQWNELHFKIIAQEKKIQSEFRAATNAQFKARELLENAEANKSMIEPVRLATLNDDYDDSVKNLRQAKLNLTAIRKLLERSKKLANQSPEKIDRGLNPLRSKFNLFVATYDPKSSVMIMDKNPVKTGKTGTGVPSSKTTKSKASSTEKTKVSLVNIPPHDRPQEYVAEPFECRIISDTVDSATGRRRIELAPGLLFTHTDPDLRPYFKNKELITCYGQLSKIDAYVYLTIDFQIASSHSQSNFGSLQNGSLLRLQMLNGEYVSLYSLKTDRGRIDPYSGHTIFTGQYALGKDEIKKLREEELDEIRILWSTGYEDYDVYKIDFFVDHLNCLLSR